MRIPHVHKYHLDKVDKVNSEVVEVDIRPQPYIDDLGLFENRQEYIRFIIRLKILIRNSFEYTNCINFLKKKHGLDHCGVHPNMTTWNGFRIELHHTPLTIEDICHIVVAKRKDKNESLKMGDIANEVMELHYLGLVGLYPLCQMCHSMCHPPEGANEGDDLFIPIANVFGDPDKFYELYKHHVTESMQAKYENLKLLNKGYTLIEQNIPLELQKQYIYVKAKDSDESMISTRKLVGFINEIGTKK